MALVACKKTELASQIKPIPYTGPSVMFEEINTLYSEEALLRIKLESKLQLVQQNGDVMHPKGLKISVYEPDGTKSNVVRADSAIYVKETDTYSAFGKVEVINLIEMQRVNTEELHWDKRKKEIYTSKPLSITTPNETIFGIGMTSNETFSRYKIWKTTGIFNVVEGAGPNTVVRDSTDFRPTMQAPTSPDLTPPKKEEESAPTKIVQKLPFRKDGFNDPKK